jgi:hypothetical protein
MDDPVDESSSPSRVGLAVKGVLPREISLEKPIAYYEKQKFLVLKPDSKTTRIIAEGSFPSVNQ